MCKKLEDLDYFIFQQTQAICFSVHINVCVLVFTNMGNQTHRHMHLQYCHHVATSTGREKECIFTLTISLSLPPFLFYFLTLELPCSGEPMHTPASASDISMHKA